MRKFIDIVTESQLPSDTIIDLRDHPELAADYEYSWGWNPVERGKFFGVIGVRGRVTKVFTSEQGAKKALGRENTRAHMAGFTKPDA